MLTIDLNLWGLSVSRIKKLEDRLLQLQAELEKLKAEEQEPKLPKYGQIVEATDYNEWPDRTYTFRHGINGDATEWKHWRPLRTPATRIEWSGGDCPVDPEQWVVYETRYGNRDLTKGHWYDWSHTDGGTDIVAYWVLEEE